MEKEEDLPFIDSSEILAAEFRRLFDNRILNKASIKSPRKNLSIIERNEILRKSGNHCHICGQKLEGLNFQIDHIFPHSIGGNCDIDNFMAACNLCNNYRWFYLPDEVKWIMKIGVWAKTQIEFETEIGKAMSKEFIEYEKSREQRRKKKREPLKLDVSKYPLREKIDYLKFQQRINNKPNENAD